MNDLYLIRNIGCDDETCGLARISKDFFNTFKNIIEDLNKNSFYSCMPTINVYKIDENILREATDKDIINNKLYLGDKKYVLKKDIYDWKTDNYIEGVERVI